MKTDKKGEYNMYYHQKQYRGESMKKAKRRKEAEALSNVVSWRINDQEKRELEKITKSSSKNVSEIVREAIESWMSRRRRLCLDS
jgi:glucan phosphorylase